MVGSVPRAMPTFEGEPCAAALLLDRCASPEPQGLFVPLAALGVSGALKCVHAFLADLVGTQKQGCCCCLEKDIY